MNLFKLSNNELNLKLKTLAQQEREILKDIILHIQEVHRRKLFLNMGYSSLFSYMTEYLQYSAASAMRRIDAARLVKDLPQTLSKIESGELNLSQVALLQQTVRQVEKTSAHISLDKKEELVSSIMGLNKLETEIQLAKALDLPILKHNTQKLQADESVKVEINFSKEEWQEVQLMRELISHSVTGDLKEVILHLSRKIKKQKIGNALKIENLPKNISKVKVDKKLEENNITKNDFHFKKSVSQRKSVPKAMRQKIFQQFSSCQYTDKRTNKKCNSNWQLQLEHIQPLWANGIDSLDNLTVFCGLHNRFQYEKQIGIKYRS